MTPTPIVVLPGDGVGRQVLPAALEVLEAVGFAFEPIHGEIGWEAWCTRGNALPPETLDLLAEHRLGLFGAITSKPKAQAEAELAPSLRGRGLVYASPIVGLRQHFGLDLCLRPCRSFPGNPLNFVRRGADGELEEPPVDLVVFRQNTEGLYAGVEWTDPPPAVRTALASHPRFAPFADTPGPDLAVTTRLVTRGASRRILEAAFAHAARHGYPSVTLAEKPNVLRETSGLMEEEARRIAAEHPGVELVSANVDALLMHLVARPEAQGVIVAGNLFGDLLSDAGAALVGGLGFAASANVGPDVALFEPTHGSAPELAAVEPALANPIAMILSAALLLDHVGQGERAEAVRRAVATVVREGRVRTFDMLRLAPGPAALEAGAATTEAMTAAIVGALDRA